jgi:hypothetical protein
MDLYDTPLTAGELTTGMLVVNQDRTRGGYVTIAADPGGFEVTWYDRGPVFYSNDDAAYLRRARSVVHVDETMTCDGGYVPAMVYECEAGFHPLTGDGPDARPWVWGPTLEQAQETAAQLNGFRGISAQQAREVVVSSLRADAGRVR